MVAWRIAARLLMGVVVLLAFLNHSGAQAPPPKDGVPQQPAAKQLAKDKPGAIRPGDVLEITTSGVSPLYVLNGLYTVEPSGKVPLGIIQGRLAVVGRTFEEVEKALVETCRNPPFNFKDPLALVTAPGAIRRHEPKDRPGLEERLDRIEKQLRALSADPRPAKEKAPPAKAAHIRPGDALEITVSNVPPKWTLEGIYTVEPSGKVPFGTELGRITMAGLTLEEAEAALVKQVAKLGPLKEDPKALIMTPGTVRPLRANERPELEQRLDQIEKQLREIKTSLGVITGARQR